MFYAIGQEINFYIGENVYSGVIQSVQAREVFVRTGYDSIYRVSFANIIDEDSDRLSVFEDAVRDAGALLY